MVYVNVTYIMKKEVRDDFLADIVNEKMSEKTNQEKGNHYYEFSVPIDSDDKVYLREKWEDEGFEEHKVGENIKQMGVFKDKYNIETIIEISHA